MPVAKVIEIICEGASIEEAVQNGLKEVTKTVRNVKHINIENVHVKVENNKIKHYRVLTKFSFLHE